MKSKNLILQRFSLECGRDGILFIDSIPIHFKIENVAKQLQIEVWLDTSPSKGNPQEYIR